MRYGGAATSKGREELLHMHMRTAKVLIAAMAGALVLAAGAVPAAASARHGTQVTAAADQYNNGGGGGVLGEQAGGAGGTGGLPFTGLNLLLVLGAGSGLIASGIGVRAASNRLHRS